MKKIILSIFITIFIILFIGAMTFSIYKFKVINPISSCLGMLQILYTDKEYTIVQRIPQKVVLAKPRMLDKYMEKCGFYELKEEQLGANHRYSNGEKEEGIYIRTNDYYMIGIWNN